MGHPANFGFPKEHVQVFGHEDIAEDVETMALPKMFESGEEDGSGVVVVQIGAMTVTAEGDEMVLALGLVSLESGGHSGLIVASEGLTVALWGWWSPTHAR